MSSSEDIYCCYTGFFYLKINQDITELCHANKHTFVKYDFKPLYHLTVNILLHISFCYALF